MSTFILLALFALATPQRLQTPSGSTAQRQSVQPLVQGAAGLQQITASGGIPSGSMILRESQAPLPGYTFTGMSVLAATGGTPSWSTKAPLPLPSAGHAAVSVKDKIYVIGGLDGVGNSVREYDPATNTWTAKAQLPTVRVWLAAAVVNDKIYALGGLGADLNTPLNTVDEYDPANNTWTSKTPMATGRYHLSAVALNGRIYAIGGSDTMASVSSMEVYDPILDTWSSFPLPFLTLAAAAVTVSDKLYLIGGFGNNPSLAEYSNGSWVAKAALPVPLGQLAAAVWNGKIYAVGGTDNWGHAPFRDVYEYDPAVDNWTTRISMPSARADLAAVAVNGRFYALGGDTDSDANEVFDTTTRVLYAHTKN